MKAHDAGRLRIFIGVSDTYHGRALYQAIVEVLCGEGLAGATVLRGIEGFGKSSRLHASSPPLRRPPDRHRMRRHHRQEAILPLLGDMIGDGLITMEHVDVRTYPTNGD